MRAGGGARAARVAFTAMAGLIAACLPAFGATSLTSPDGSTFTVWEDHPAQDGAQTAARWAVAYSISDAAGTRLGTIDPTGDPAADTSPQIARDPSTGFIVALWSRFDGMSPKIAYARYDGTGFTDVHFLTFGRGGETLPRVGTALSGSYLFWVENDLRYLYAPVDLAAGHLFAAPKLLPLGLLKKEPIDLGRATPPSSSFAGAARANPGGRATGSTGRLVTSPDATLQAGQDVPVVTGNSDGGSKNPPKASVWGAGGDPDCTNVVLIIPDRNLRAASVVKFNNGALEVLQRISLPSPVPDRFGEIAAAAYLASACR